MGYTCRPSLDSEGRRNQALSVQIWQRPCPHHPRGLSLPPTEMEVSSMERSESTVRASRTSVTSAWVTVSRKSSPVISVFPLRLLRREKSSEQGRRVGT